MRSESTTTTGQAKERSSTNGLPEPTSDLDRIYREADREGLEILDRELEKAERAGKLPPKKPAR